MNLAPIAGNVVIKQSEAEDTTPGGILLPDAAKEKPKEGEVVAVGPGRMDDGGLRIIPQVTAGDKVLFIPYGAVEVASEGEDYLVMSEENILAVIQEE